ncbi:MAG: hypothetical protein ACP5HG_04795 [Anaerolineae bacterium]
MEKIKQFVNEHPQWTSWIVLAVGMVAILVWSARDVGLLPGQWAALIIATILVAGLAVWIIGWEDEEELEELGDDAAPERDRAPKKAAPAQAKDTEAVESMTEAETSSEEEVAPDAEGEDA